MVKGVKRTSNINTNGFTIIETLIVLAVTAILGISVALLVSGKQSATQFQTATNDLRTQMQQVSGGVVNGSFPDGVNLGCQKSINIVKLTNIVSNSGDCAFLGNVIHFQQQTDSNYSVYTMVGLNDDTAIDFSDVAPFLAAKTTGSYAQNPGNAVGDGITTNSLLQYGLSVASMTYSTDGGVSNIATGSFGLVQNLGSGSSSTGRHSLLMVFTGTGGSKVINDQEQEAKAIDDDLIANHFIISDSTASLSVSVCLQSGTTNQWALLKISNASSQLDFTTQITSTDCST